MHPWTRIFWWHRRTSEVDAHVSSPKDDRQLGLSGSAVRHDMLVCNLKISLNNEVLPSEISFATKWGSNEVFQALNDEATGELKQKIELGTRTLFLRYGRCRLVTPDACAKFHPLRNQSQWHEAVKNTVHAVILQTQKDHLRLDVRLGYSAIQLEPINGQCYAHTLRNEISRQMQTNFENRAYVLLNEFIGLLSVVGLQRLLQEDQSLRSTVKNDSSFEKNFVRDISQNARTLLALCIYAGLPLLFLQALRDQGLSDAHLPLRPEQYSSKLILADFDLLMSQQWVFLPYRFKKQKDLLRLEPELIVPIYFDSDLDMVGVGSYSNVYRVSINQACHDFLSDEHACFALKHFNSCQTMAGPCQRELAMLNKISRFPNPHIVSHFAAWEQSNSLFILFPLARGDLRWFMTQPKPTLDQGFILWFLRQLLGLADGIHHLHNLNSGVLSNISPHAESRENGIAALHLDLKPENILVFDHGTVNHAVFMISDFGSGKVKQHREEGNRRFSGSTKTAETALTYTGPDKSLNGTISRPYDMWSLGCIFLELLSWVHLGPKQGVDEFATARLQNQSHQAWRDDAFWQSSNDKREQLNNLSLVSLKPAVLQRFKYLESHCLKVFKPVLASIWKLLNVNPAERIKSQGLLSELEAVYLQASRSTKR